MPHKNSITTQNTFDYLIVFGEGPVKPVLLTEELSSTQQTQWTRYKEDPLRVREPGFSCITQRRLLVELQKIDLRMDLSGEDKARHREAVRMHWQYTGWYALRPWGRQNAFAAGYALYKGISQKIILSGGRTISEGTKKLIPQIRQENWPSEAELMKDIIKQSYGELYEKKYGEPIDKAIIIENSSTNTLENFVYTINNNPELLGEDKKVGLLSADHHLKRVTMLAELFCVKRREKQSAQAILKQLSVENDSEIIGDILQFAHNKQSEELDSLTAREEQLIKGLVEPKYVTYWLGYIGMVDNCAVVHNAFQRLRDPLWCDSAKAAFSKLGLNFEEFMKEDIVGLHKHNPQKYNLLVQSLRKLRKPEFRSMPL